MRGRILLLGAFLGGRVPLLAQNVALGEEGKGGGLAGIVGRLALPRCAMEQLALHPREVGAHVK